MLTSYKRLRCFNPKITDVFSFKPKDSSFTVINDTEKQQMFDISDRKVTQLAPFLNP